MSTEEFSGAFYITLVFFSLLAMGVVFFVVRYTTKQKEFRHSKALREKEFLMEIAKVQTEVAENTINRISEELHDNVCQSLLLSCRELEIESSRHADNEKIIAIKDDLKGTLNTLRSLSHSLSNHRLQNGLRDALQLELDRISVSFSIKSELVIDMNEDHHSIAKLDEGDVDLILYRCFQELIANILKHSKASEIIVILKGNAERWHRLEVLDNGGGFNIHSSKKGLGLAHVQQRMNALNGKVEINSEIGKGSSIALIL